MSNILGNDIPKDRAQLQSIGYEAGYANGLRDGIKQGLLQAAEMFEDMMPQTGPFPYSAYLEAIRAEAEKEGK